MDNPQVIDAVPAGYTFRGELGRGRLGSVLLCRDDASGKDVVVRVLATRPGDDRARAVLETELASAATAGRHPCAVPIDAVWFDDGAGPCLRQQFRPGGSAQALLDAGATWQAEDVAVAGLRAAVALAHSHARGVLHLDVRPANLLADDSGAWSLADGGLARPVTRSCPGASPAFDPHYAPREMFGWEEPGPPCDVYGLGATLHALLAGAPPGAPPRARAQAPGAVPSTAMAGLISRMTAADPSARPPLAEVERVLRSQLGPAAVGRVPGPATGAVRPVAPLPVRQLATLVPATATDGAGERRRRVLLAAAGITAVFVAAAAITVATLDGDRAKPTEQVVAQIEEPTAAPVVAPVDVAPTEKPAPATPVVDPDRLRPLNVPAALRVEHLVSDVTLSKGQITLLVGWLEPGAISDVAGYLVEFTAKVKGKEKVLARQYVPAGQVLATFSAPPVTPTSCFAVHTLVDTGDDIRIARRAPDCKTARAVLAPKAKPKS